MKFYSGSKICENMNLFQYACIFKFQISVINVHVYFKPRFNDKSAVPNGVTIYMYTEGSQAFKMNKPYFYCWTSRKIIVGSR